jgi:uncharacterized membrane protein
VRFTGISFAYNVSYALIGGLTPLTLATLLSINPLSHIFYLMFISCLAIAVGIYLWRCPEIIQHSGPTEVLEGLWRV